MTDASDMEPAALAKWLENEAYDADSRALNFKGGTPQRKDWQIRAKRFRAAALAARSAPEAGKAVDETAHDLVMRSVSLLSSLLMESPRFSTELNDKFFTLRDDMRQWLVNQADAALASSPAPTGAEPVAWRWRDGDMRWQATADEDRASYAFRVDGYEVEDLYASPHPVAPTGEIAGLVERLNSHRLVWRSRAPVSISDMCEEAAAALTSLFERIQSSEHALGHEIRIKGEIVTSLRAYEAEAADLRRKLEEHQDAEDKAAREMATVIQGLRNRATAAERKLEEARRALEEIKSDAKMASAYWNGPEQPSFLRLGELAANALSGASE